ncbi:hypothetical protein JCM19237_1333 [Photobacterium aphoticum]|uniref:Uncharacterized protein n=1 Tax=Photobacterium aphoticum TaxID=754436 RepID=A0A090QP14_9GAMM|nr:hypothetical protein JCM19237_1333 [Photobacterium aphoticum]
MKNPFPISGYISTENIQYAPHGKIEQRHEGNFRLSTSYEKQIARMPSHTG